jgi:hypothetical protein
MTVAFGIGWSEPARRTWPVMVNGAPVWAVD